MLIRCHIIHHSLIIHTKPLSLNNPNTNHGQQDVYNLNAHFHEQPFQKVQIFWEFKSSRTGYLSSDCCWLQNIMNTLVCISFIHSFTSITGQSCWAWFVSLALGVSAYTDSSSWSEGDAEGARLKPELKSWVSCNCGSAAECVCRACLSSCRTGASFSSSACLRPLLFPRILT